MRIQLLKRNLIGHVNHAQGDVVECDDQRAKALIKQGHALKITTTGPDAPAPETDDQGDDDEDGPADPEIRRAVANPGARRGRTRS